MLLLLLQITVVIGGDDDRDSNSSGFEENIGRFPGNAFYNGLIFGRLLVVDDDAVLLVATLMLLP